MRAFWCSSWTLNLHLWFSSENLTTVYQTTRRHVWGHWSPNNEHLRSVKVWNLFYIYIYIYIIYFLIEWLRKPFYRTRLRHRNLKGHNLLAVCGQTLSAVLRCSYWCLLPLNYHLLLSRYFFYFTTNYAFPSSKTSEDSGRMRSHFEAHLCIQSETIPAEVSLFCKENRKGD